MKAKHKLVGLEEWLVPFLRALKNVRRQRWAPLYIQGLLLPGERKSMEPISSRVAPNEVQQIHHFVSTSTWDTAPLEAELCRQVDKMLGGASSYLIVDDTGLPKKGTHSVGVAHQYCGALGKQANSQNMVSLTLSRNDVPAPVGLRLYLPKSWTEDKERMASAKVPVDVAYKPKWSIALDEIDRVRASGVRFGAVLADAGYGMCAEFRRGLTERKLMWAVGILSTQNMYAPDVQVISPAPLQHAGRPRTRSVASAPPEKASDYITAHARFRTITWRQGKKAPLQGRFAITRVRTADGPETKNAVHLPGDTAWLVCEELSNGERKYYLSNLPETAKQARIVSAIKARWSCEQMHQQAKEELGLDHFEGRSWTGLHHHTILTMIAFAYLVHARTHENIPVA